MSDGRQNTFYKAIRSDDHRELLRRPNEYALLSLIAYRARRTNGFSVDNLKSGEALIGDFKSVGLTQQKYRTAKKNLEKWGFITTKATNKGTIAKLINNSIFDANIDSTNEQTNIPSTNKYQPDSNRVTTNKKAKNEKEVIAFPNGKAASGHYSEQYKAEAEEIKTLCLTVKTLCARQRISFNAFAWVQKMAGVFGHPQAIIKALNSLIRKLNKKEAVRNPYGYLTKIFNVENGNFHEADAVKHAQAFKTAFNADTELSQLAGGIGQRI